VGMLSGLDIHYDLGDGHPLLGRRIPDLELQAADGPARIYGLLHDARPALIDLDGDVALDIAPWADRVKQVSGAYDGPWELPVLGEVAAPSAALVRPDGHVAWVGEGTAAGLEEALVKWFGPPAG
jgi:3-(3-hydroxy-phenyl)propionate hydroxylase